ncbi:MAG: hypothetical protein AB7S26_16270 [Sandaracinaceae bacterium]
MRLLVGASVFGVTLIGCANGGGPSGPDAGPGPECAVDSDCPDDGIFCNGTVSCVSGSCVAAAIPSCNDGVACTVDTCNPTSDACENMPDNAMCPTDTVCYVGTGCADAPPCEFDADCGGDGVYCNGVEVCVDTRCLSPMSGRSCDDMNSCTMDECVEASTSCMNTPYPDIATNVAHCGTGSDDCVTCPEPDASLHQLATCVAGACGVECAPGFVDVDGDPANGCEVMCSATPGADLPDDAFLDANCDGIDGDRALAIFVSTTGNDSRDGLTPATSVGSIARALAVRIANPSRNQILIANGIYTLTTMQTIPSGIGLYGGYSNDFSTRTDTRASIQATSQTAFRASGLTQPTVLDHLSVSTSDRSGTSEPTIVLIVTSSLDRLTLRHTTLLAGRGGNGTNGATTSATGTTGTMGGAASGSTRGLGGNPGGGGTSGRGGNGASGRTQDTGPPGVTGDPGSCGSGGAPGGGSGGAGIGCADGDPQPGGPGGPGCPGAAGGDGAGGDGIGAVAGEAWIVDTASAGARGGVGGGGGGGGAGAGEDCTDPVFGTCIYCGTGRGGGGGGGGGQGGPGGNQGAGGGASIGVLLINSTLVAQDLRIQTSGGGNGGLGRIGGFGGGGGPGGPGVVSGTTTEGSGGNGGAGGSGGRGGCGGGGGGGPSVAIWGNGTNARVRELSPVTYSPGPGGTGGGSCGNAGDPGISTNLRSAFIE